MERARVLVVDDKENIRKLIARILEETCDVTMAADGARAIALLAARHFDAIVTDLRMPGADGFEVLRAAKARSPETEVVMMTAYATVPDAVEAMKQGAFDYLAKPFDPDDAALVVARALERRRLRAQGGPTAGGSAEPPYAFHDLIGRSPPMLEAYRLLEQAAGLDITVLLNGETGTGKELAESELFGHARGAFTGAAGAKPGLFEEAQGGTIFLDEIGELPLPVQVKLNRALQEREIRRVGETRPIAVDVRIIAATHRDLKAEVQAGRFREDLFYRLNVFPVRLPALRERREDVPLLAAHFLAKHAN